MTQYCIVEDDNGWKVVDHPDTETADTLAHRLGVNVIDSGPYHSWEDATDALEALQLELGADLEGDVPNINPLEGRYENED